MKYAILLYSREDLTEEESAPMQAWFDYTAELEAAGVMAGGEALGECLVDLGRPEAARQHLSRARELTDNEAERTHLLERLEALDGP